ncbi:MAG: TolC family protein [Syntrophales bacterium]|jgi:outer membrane protein TolC|nr:TolC family protein [Syntrophales bacterium]
MRKSCLLAVLCLVLFIPVHVSADETIIPGQTLKLERCIEIALAKHPDILAASHQLRVGESRIGQAQSAYFPQLNMETGYDRTQAYKPKGRNLSGTSASDFYSGYLGLSQNIYDFGRTPAKVGIASANQDAFRQDLANVVSLVVLNVKQSYYTMLQAEENRRVAEETVDQFQRHLDIAKGFFEAGLKPKFDVTKAEVDLSNARLTLIKAENALRIAGLTLNNAMGMPDAPEFVLDSNLLFERYKPLYQDALREAYENRPDLQSLLYRESAAHKSFDLARAGHYPTVTSYARYGFGGREFPLGEGWSVGGSLNIPIFSGYLVKNQIAESKADIDVLSANIVSLKQQIRLEISQAFSNLRETASRIETTDLIVRQARENLELAEGRYASGLGSPIEVTDALLALSNARTANISALSDYGNALAALERAVGVK